VQRLIDPEKREWTLLFSFAGSSVTRGNSSSFYDGAGRFSGSSVRHGNQTLYYDRQGRFSGSAINTGPRR
jgi:YD repeat-containing protein